MNESRGFTVTITCTIDEYDVVTNDIDLMATVTAFIADQVPRYFTAVADCTAEGAML